MPMIFVEGPPGLSPDARRTLAAELTKALDEAFHVPDVRFWLREYASENYAQDGTLGAPVRPIAVLETPELADADAKRALVNRINAAMVTAFEGVADTEDIMVFINGYPLEQVGWAGRLQSDNPDVVALVHELNG